MLLESLYAAVLTGLLMSGNSGMHIEQNGKNSESKYYDAVGRNSHSNKVLLQGDATFVASPAIMKFGYLDENLDSLFNEYTKGIEYKENCFLTTVRDLIENLSGSFIENILIDSLIEYELEACGLQLRKTYLSQPKYTRKKIIHDLEKKESQALEIGVFLPTREAMDMEGETYLGWVMSWFYGRNNPLEKRIKSCAAKDYFLGKNKVRRKVLPYYPESMMQFNVRQAIGRCKKSDTWNDRLTQGRRRGCCRPKAFEDLIVIYVYSNGEVELVRFENMIVKDSACF
ncbi:hypothetical protein CI610_02575 [invertebrate metagenome]|uniref:Uncharacterized protein n=1 Tax=invertebrate metagenome TaxID=1711999 RepID=A0A2H9T5I7_9ZZZZ